MVKLKDMPCKVYEVATMEKFPDRVFLRTVTGTFLCISVQRFVAMVVNETIPEKRA